MSERINVTVPDPVKADVLKLKKKLGISESATAVKALERGIKAMKDELGVK